MDSSPIPKPGPLQESGFLDSPADPRALPPDLPVCELLKGDPAYGHVEIDAIKEWTRDPIPVPGHERWVAVAPISPVTEEPARTGIHGRHQDEP